MDFVGYVKRENWTLFGKTFLHHEVIYHENSGETQGIQITVRPDYYNSEFKVNDKNKNNNQKP